jgi:hypothetical protein
LTEQPSIEAVSQDRLYRLAKRLSVGRFLRYLDLWARYGWQSRAIPILLPAVRHPNTLVSFSETIADHTQYADYTLATSARVARVGLDPLGDLDAKTRRTKAALTQARRAESKSGGEHSAGLLKR